MINTIILGHALNVLPQLPAESVNCCVTSPPYWNLRDYGVDPVIWDGDKDCKHVWGNKTITLKHKSGETNPGKESWFKDRGASNDKGNCFCLKCEAWKGSLGLEPTFELYIKHLCDIFDEVKRVLRKDGTCFVNIGDSYGGSGNASGHKEYTKNLGYKSLEMGATQGNQKSTGQYAKSLLDIPYRFSIEMINRGWIKRNTIIWHKPNCMPSSADDRFTVDFEYLFFFTKNNKAIFWTNEKTLECVGKKPLGIKGIEDKDWEWRPCPRCQGTGGETKIEKENAETMGSIRARYHRITKQENCKRCKGLGKVKISLWTGHDYWFEQQFEKYQYPLDRWGGIYTNGNVPNSKYLKEDIDPAQITKRPRSFRPNENGRNQRAVWTIPTRPFPEAHFAVYPKGLIETPIKAGCPEFVCKKCGKARVKILEPTEEYKKFLGKSWHDHLDDKGKGFGQQTRGFSSRKGKVNGIERYKNLGYTDCGCHAGFEPGIVLDPFMGAGTTALVALKQRKRFIGIEIKQEYIDMAKRRIANVQQRIF